jgi:hypothetical protein
MRDPKTCLAASTGFSPKAEILKATPKRPSNPFDQHGNRSPDFPCGIIATIG